MKLFPGMECTPHPLRTNLYDELHIRPFPKVTAPQQITHLAFRAQKQEHGQAFELLCRLCRQQGVNPPMSMESSALDFGNFRLQWESHVEFYSITVMCSPEPEAELFASAAIGQLAEEWLSEQPGEVVAAFHLEVVSDPAAVTEEALAGHFDGNAVSISETVQGNATLYTDFRLHQDGFGRFIILNQGMAGDQLGQLSRRLIEMETYRLFAMLAFPLAKRLGPQLVEMDQQMASMLAGLSELNSLGEERELLMTLSELASRLEAWRAETNRSFSGAKAYHEMIRDRLHRIAENRVTCNSSLGDFMNRRLDPALRTCASVHAMMEDLSTRIERAGDLLRTRINLTLQEQNRSLLQSMNSRSRLQFRLQETVEGLSVVAISYYLVGLIKYLLDGLPLKELGLDKATLVTISIPVVLCGILYMTKRIKHRLFKEPT